MDTTSVDNGDHAEQHEEIQGDEKSIAITNKLQPSSESYLNIEPAEGGTSLSIDSTEMTAEGDSESEYSEPDSPTNMEDNVVQNEEDHPNKDERVKKKKRKQRKKRDPNKRKKIRKLFTEDKLNTETLEAMKQEEERKKRLEEQAIRFSQQAESFNYLNQTEANTPSTVLRPSEFQSGSSFLASLLTSNVPQAQPLVSHRKDSLTTDVKQQKKQHPSEDVICISSDSEEEKVQRSKAADTIDLSSDSSDDVICTGEMTEDAPEPEDVNNSGMHIEDAKNQRDSEGRVLVNVNRPSNEPEIFLSPQLATAVLPHQIGGIRFMFDNIVESLSHYESNVGFGCILAHSMGLGKTLQVISFVEVFLRYTSAKTVLIVVPVNTLMNWVSEFNMWLPPKSKCLDANPAQVWPRAFSVHILSDNHKTTESRAKVVGQWNAEGGVLLLGYEMYRLLTSGKTKKRRRRKNNLKAIDAAVIDLEEEDRISMMMSGIQSSLMKPGPDLIICDEGHRIKNSHASISQTLKNVKTRRRIVLTGYPLQNNLLEYWCMVDFVRPNFLGTKNEFSNMFERPITNGQCADSTEGDVRLMRFRSHVLHSLLKGFVQRRSHSVLSQTLPFKEEHVFLVRLSEWQKKLYNSFWTLKMAGTSGSWCSANNPIKAFSVCCKIWNHPDVLYRTVQLRSEENNDIDPDLDLPDPIEGSLSVKPKNQQKSPQSSNSNIFNSTSSTVNGDNSSSGASPTTSSSSASVIQTPGLNSFGDTDRGKRVNYEWAKDLMAGYSTGVLELSGKMVVLMQIIQLTVSRGDRLLVFSQSLKTLTLIEEFLWERFVPRRSSDEVARKWAKNQSYFRLDGNTTSSDREKLIKQFNSPDNKAVHLFLLSTRAGCLGINLIGANRVVVFDASWNPCHDAQAVCRVYRYGQMKTCHVYRLVSDQTMEKKIYERQITKQGMSDRVVDKLNPAQQYTKQDVLSLLEYSNVELPKVDFSEIDEEYNDSVLKDICKMSGHWFTKKPFTHESLLLDCKDQRLTKAEQRAAEKGYERDKLASSAYNYGRQSYSGFYGSSNPANPANSASMAGKSKPPLSNFQPYTSLSHDNSRPIANVRPMQSTPFPLQLQSNLANSSNTSYYQKAGISVQKVVATTNIPLPSTNTATRSSANGQLERINAGETICIIRGKKGTYIRTSLGRIFAVRLNDQSRFTTPGDTETRLTNSTSMNSPITSDVAGYQNDVTNGTQSPFSLAASNTPWSDELPSFAGPVQSNNATSSTNLYHPIKSSMNYPRSPYSSMPFPPMVPLQRPPPNYLNSIFNGPAATANSFGSFNPREMPTNSQISHSRSSGALNLSSSTNGMPGFAQPSSNFIPSTNEMTTFSQSPLNSNSPTDQMSAFLQSSVNSNSPTNQMSAFSQPSVNSNSPTNQMSTFPQSPLDTNSLSNQMSAFSQPSENSNSPTNQMSAFSQPSVNSISPTNQMPAFSQSFFNSDSTTNQISAFSQPSVKSNSPTNQMTAFSQPLSLNSLTTQAPGFPQTSSLSTSLSGNNATPFAQSYMNSNLSINDMSGFNGSLGSRDSYFPTNQHSEPNDHQMSPFNNTQLRQSYSMPAMTGLDQFNSNSLPIDLTNAFPSSTAASQPTVLTSDNSDINFFL